MKTCLAITAVLLIATHAAKAIDWFKPRDIPDKAPAPSLPVIVGDSNEVFIAKSFNDTDPSMVLGSIVDRQTKEVIPLENYLKSDAKPVEEIKTEMLYRHLIERDIGGSASYLGFVTADLSDNRKAEITLIKNRVRSIKKGDLDIQALNTKIASLRPEDKDRFGIIIAYTDYLFTASFFKAAERKADASGYGAKLGGRWFNKEEGLKIERSVVATFAPLTVIPAVISSPSTQPLKEVIRPQLNQLQIPRIDQLRIKQ
jgi:hypothetical protein